MKKYEREIKALGKQVCRDGGAMLVTAVSGGDKIEHLAFVGDTADAVGLVELAFKVALTDCQPRERAFIADQLLRIAIEQNREAIKILEESRKAEQ